MSPDVSNPAYLGRFPYMDLYNVYKEQVEALVDGGVDIILFETTFEYLECESRTGSGRGCIERKG